jgi:hypothetical protein
LAIRIGGLGDDEATSITQDTKLIPVSTAEHRQSKQDTDSGLEKVNKNQRKWAKKLLKLVVVAFLS